MIPCLGSDSSGVRPLKSVKHSRQRPGAAMRGRVRRRVSTRGGRPGRASSNRPSQRSFKNRRRANGVFVEAEFSRHILARQAVRASQNDAAPLRQRTPPVGAALRGS